METLTSPERLDSLMQVTSKKGWIALIACLAVSAAAVVWGFMGNAPDVVHGSGILEMSGGIFQIEARGAGVLTAVQIRGGGSVTEGQVIGTVAQPDVQQTITQQQSKLQELKRNRTQQAQLVTENRDALLRSLEEDRTRLNATATAVKDQITFLQERVQAQTQAVQEGLLTKDQRQATAEQLASAQENQISNQAQLIQLDATEATTRNTAVQQIFALDQAIADAERLAQLTQERYKLQTEVVSPYTGTVIAQLVDEGQNVGIGTAVFSVELSERRLEALAFIPLQGTRIHDGMNAMISPNGITWEEYGYLLGTVTAVADSPISPDAMNRLLRNETLVTQFSGQGGVYMITIKLEDDPDTVSKFKWTSTEGPPLTFGSGTLFDVQITVEDRRPITLAIPALREWLGL